MVQPQKAFPATPESGQGAPDLRQEPSQSSSALCTERPLCTRVTVFLPRPEPVLPLTTLMDSDQARAGGHPQERGDDCPVPTQAPSSPGDPLTAVRRAEAKPDGETMCPLCCKMDREQGQPWELQRVGPNTERRQGSKTRRSLLGRPFHQARWREPTAEAWGREGEPLARQNLGFPVLQGGLTLARLCPFQLGGSLQGLCVPGEGADLGGQDLRRGGCTAVAG